MHSTSQIGQPPNKWPARFTNSQDDGHYTFDKSSDHFILYQPLKKRPSKRKTFSSSSRFLISQSVNSFTVVRTFCRPNVMIGLISVLLLLLHLFAAIADGSDQVSNDDSSSSSPPSYFLTNEHRPIHHQRHHKRQPHLKRNADQNLINRLPYQDFVEQINHNNNNLEVNSVESQDESRANFASTPSPNFNFNHLNHHRKSHHRPQVPEQSLISVVSSSDNSYVSASPIFREGSSNNKRHNTPSSSNLNDDGEEASRAFSNSYQLNYDTNNNNKLAENHKSSRHHSHRQQQHHHRKHPHQHTRRLSRISNDFIDQQIDNATLSGHGLALSELDGQIGSSNGDISTTATTTQRNKDGTTNIVQLSDDEAAKLHPLELDLHASLAFERDDNYVHQRIKLSAQGQVNLIRSDDANINLQYTNNENTIIKTRDSIRMGAKFINFTIVTNLNACLVECWITDSCDTTIYQEHSIDPSSNVLFSTRHNDDDDSSISSLFHARKSDPDDDDEPNSIRSSLESNEDNDDVSGGRPQEPARTITRSTSSDGFHVCYMFQCAKSDQFKCTFSSHGNYISSVRTNVGQMSPMKNVEPNYVKTVNEINGCNANNNKFKCSSSDKCIATSRVCDNILDCPDGSDEQALICDKSSVDRSHITLDGYSVVGSSSDGGRPLDTSASAPRYSKIVSSHHKLSRWHDSHLASIQIGQEDGYERGGINSALIAIMFGIGATGMLILIVNHRMKSIRRRIVAHRSRRRSMVSPSTEFLINTLPT